MDAAHDTLERCPLCGGLVAGADARRRAATGRRHLEVLADDGAQMFEAA